MALPISPELRLAAACAMWPASNRRIEAIRAATAVPLNWPGFVRVARRHDVVGLVHDGLRRLRADVPPEITREIGLHATTLIHKNVAMAHESLRLQRFFDNEDLPVLFVKGAALAIRAFGNLSLRGSQDIDLLVAHEHLPAATAIILRAGYRRFDPPPHVSDAQLRTLMPLRKDIAYVHEQTGIHIELHWRLFLNPHTMPEASINAASQVVPLAGTVGLRTLGEDDLFAYLCMHGALHAWNRLKWLADVNALLTSTPEDGVEHFVGVAEAKGVGRAAAQALLLCERILGTALPARLTAMLNMSATVRWLEATALKAITTGQGEQDPHGARFGTTRGSLSTFFLSRSWRYRLAELKIHLTNPTDVLTMPLPEQLRFLYPLLRLPLWLWRHAGKQGIGR